MWIAGTWLLMSIAQPVATSSTASVAPALVEDPAPPLAVAEPRDAGAEDDGEDGGQIFGLSLPIDIHGFVTQGYFKSTDNNYLGDSERGSFAYTEVGINFSKQLTERLRAGIQFNGRVIGDGELAAHFDWFFLDYRWNNWLGLRVGRVKLPFGLYNEFSDIDSARVPILLPQSVYPVQNRDFLLAQTGLELYGDIGLDDAGSVGYRLYGGTIVFRELSNTGPLEVTDIDTPYLVGGRLGWDTPITGLRLMGSVQLLQIDFDVAVDPSRSEPLIMMGRLPADFSGSFGATVGGLLWLTSIEYVSDHLVVAAEYGRWTTDLESEQQALAPDSQRVREHFYVMANYQFDTWLHPSVYYAVLFPDVENRKGRAGSQQDVALSFRFDINEFWLVKLEGHYMRGTALLSPALNDGVPNNRLERDWGLLLVDTTLHF